MRATKSKKGRGKRELRKIENNEKEKDHSSPKEANIDNSERLKFLLILQNLNSKII
jgi:hypothetical protein